MIVYGEKFATFAISDKEEWIMNMTNIKLPDKRGLTISLLFSIVLLLVLASCQNEVEKRLSQKGNMWYVYGRPNPMFEDLDSTSKYLVHGFGCFKFKSNGNLLHVDYNDEINQYVEYDPIIDDIEYLDKWYYKENKNELLLWDGKYRILAFVEDTLLVQMFNHIDILVNLGEDFPKNPSNRAKDHFDKNNIIRLLKQGNVPNDTIEKYVR